MKRLPSRLMLGFVILTLIGFLVWLYFKGGEKTEASSGGISDSSAIFSADEGFFIVALRKGLKEFELRGDKLFYFEDKKWVEIFAPEALFKTAQEVVELKAERGWYFPEEKRIKLRGGVDVEAGGYNLTAEELNYDANEKVIETDREFSIKSDALELKAKALRWEIEKERVELMRGVKVIFKGKG